MKLLTSSLLAITFTTIGCGGQPTPTSEASEEAAAQAEASSESDAIPMRDFASLEIGPYQVQPMFEEEIKDGHYNIRVDGGDFNAVRLWVGTEDNSEVMVVKTELENDYQHGHLEVPDPIPADYALWIEIEDTEGNTHRGSTPLEMK